MYIPYRYYHQIIHILIIHLSTKSYSIKRRRKGGVNVVDPVSYQYHTSSTHCILICPISGVTTTTIDYLHLLYSSYDPSHQPSLVLLVQYYLSVVISISYDPYLLLWSQLVFIPLLFCLRFLIKVNTVSWLYPPRLLYHLPTCLIDYLLGIWFRRGFICLFVLYIYYMISTFELVDNVIPSDVCHFLV